MPLQVTFELSDADLEYFRAAMKEAQHKMRGREEAAILAGARHLARQTRTLALPAFVTERLLALDTLTRMLEDGDWKLEGAHRARVLQALAYFADPSDLVPDSIPGLGFLDDAIMIELVSQAIQHELEGYLDFCEFRRNEERNVYHPQGKISRDERMAAKRKALRARIAARDKKPAARAQSRFKLW